MGTTQPIKNREQLIQFRNYYLTENYKPRNYALIVLGLNSALRIGDILSLRWRDVYEKNQYRSHIIIKEQKTGKERYVALNKNAIAALELYRKSIELFYDSQYIFVSQKSPFTRISRAQAFRIVKKAAIACQLDDMNHISCHSLRKTFGYFAWKMGTPPALLMSIYNHSSYQITKRYLCIDQSEQDYVYQNLSL